MIETLPTSLLLHILISAICWAPARAPANSSGFDCCPIYIRFKKCWQWVRARRCHCEHPPKSWTRSSGLREHHAPLCLLWQTLPPLRKYHFVIQHTHSTLSFILHGAQSLSLSYGFIYSRNALKDLHILKWETNLCFVFICCLCVWIHRVPHKSLIEFTSVILRNRESNVFTGWCFPRGFTSVCAHCVKELASHFCDVDKWFIQQEWWTICQYFFFYRRQSSTINNSAVIKQFIGQVSFRKLHFLIQHLTESHIFHEFQRFYVLFHVSDKCFWMIHSQMIGCCRFLHCKFTRYTKVLLLSSLNYPLHKLYFRYQRQCVKGIL